MEQVKHPRIDERKKHGVHTTREERSGFNGWLAVKITGIVGTMWCAYAFTLLALVSLPDAIKGGRGPLIAWIAQTFLQLVLLSESHRTRWRTSCAGQTPLLRCGHCSDDRPRT